MQGLEKVAHPCFSIEAAHKFARLHLPVAPECNIKCSYCNREFDCVNESRPGVTSSLLSPETAMRRVRLIKKKFSNLKIIGIAGPGDALANSEATFKTLRLIREYDKGIEFCLSTNGINLVKYLDEIKETGVKYITITINSRRVEIARTLYRWAEDKEVFLKGARAAKFILQKQEEALDALKGSGIYVKVNTVYIPGVNDIEIEDIVRFVKDKGAKIVNIMPFVPTPGTYFENFPMVSRKTLNQVQRKMSSILSQMRHCRQCRADAVGNVLNEKPVFMEKDNIRELFPGRDGQREEDLSGADVLRFALTSTNGYVIDQHFGHARDLLIYDVSATAVKFIERRPVGKYCLGKEDCEDSEERMRIIKERLADCRGLLVMRIGDRPRGELRAAGLYVNMTCDRIEEAMRENYKILDEAGLMKRAE